MSLFQDDISSSLFISAKSIQLLVEWGMDDEPLTNSSQSSGNSCYIIIVLRQSKSLFFPLLYFSFPFCSRKVLWNIQIEEEKFDFSFPFPIPFLLLFFVTLVAFLCELCCFFYIFTSALFRATLSTITHHHCALFSWNERDEKPSLKINMTFY